MRKPRKSTLYLVLAAVMFFVSGFSAALLFTGSPGSVEDADAEVTEVEVVTETEVEVASEACLDALDAAETVFQASAEGFYHVADLFDALDRDSDLAFNAALNKFVEAQEAIEPHVDTYQDIAHECREAQ